MQRSGGLGVSLWNQFKPMTGGYRNAVGHAARVGGATDQTTEVNLGLRFAHLCVLASLREIAFQQKVSRKVAKPRRKPQSKTTGT
jgi:hypothetical protein